jgi:hypothetical protein
MSIMTGEPPVMTYRRTDEAAEDGPAEGKQETPFSKVANYILVGLTWAILGIVLAVWALVGMVFWIPLLLRAMLRFSLSLLEAVFEGQRPTDSARILRDAVSFYRRGFVVAVEAVTKEDLEEQRGQPMDGNRLVLEVVWAVVVWYLIFLWWGWVQTSPVDVWNWFVGLPWRETAANLLERLGL